MENFQTVQPGQDGLTVACSVKTNPDLLTAEQAASLLEVSAGTLSVWRATKRYPLRYVKIGSKVRYTREDIERFISLRTQSGVGSDRRAFARGRR
jgi:excisionase family DNA binding protein